MPTTDPRLGTSSSSPLEVSLLQAVLNQVDYGLAVVDADTAQLIFANAHALAALQGSGGQMAGLHVHGGKLCARQPGNAAHLAQALVRTKSGVRCLLNLVNGGQDASVAVMPLPAAPSPMPTATAVGAAVPQFALLAFAKQQLCDNTTITLFARERGLTGAEGQVLAQVCKGLRPQEIATRQGVQISTVRTQLRAIRHKTASDSVRELIEKVSVLPPLAWQMPSLEWPCLTGALSTPGSV